MNASGESGHHDGVLRALPVVIQKSIRIYILRICGSYMGIWRVSCLSVRGLVRQ